MTSKLRFSFMRKEKNMVLIITVKAMPSSGRNCLVVDKSGILKIYLKNEPSGGKANAELIKTIAKIVKLSAQDVSIISGHTARIKRVKINAPISYQNFLEAAGIEQQMKLF